MDLSIILPSNKDDAVISAVINSFKEAHQFYPHFNYEVLVYSRNRPSADYKLEWIQEVDSSSNTIPMWNHLYEHSVGEFIFVTSDDYAVENNFFSMLSHLKKEPHKILAPEHRGHPHYITRHGTTPILGCPMMSRNFINKELGGKIWSTSFIYHYPDCWLTYFIEKKGFAGQIISYTGLHKLVNHAPNTTHDNVDEPMYDKLVRELNDNPERTYL